MRFVITGGPGSGKTSVINALKAKGFPTFPETARQIIKDGGIAPILNSNPLQQASFFRKIIRTRIDHFNSAPEGQASFFDRGIPDSLAFSRFMGLRDPEVLVNAIRKYRYNPRVFILPPWKEIYLRDNERQESFVEASRLFDLTRAVYLESGYELTELSFSSIEKRLAVIMNAIGLPADH